jgi:hypothetical protein
MDQYPSKIEVIGRIEPNFMKKAEKLLRLGAWRYLVCPKPTKIEKTKHISGSKDQPERYRFKE